MVQWHLATAMIRGYAERYAIEDFEVVEVEKEFVGEIRNPDTGRQSQTFRIAGKVDGIVRCHDGLYLLEHKRHQPLMRVISRQAVDRHSNRLVLLLPARVGLSDRRRDLQRFAEESA